MCGDRWSSFKRTNAFCQSSVIFNSDDDFMDTNGSTQEGFLRHRTIRGLMNDSDASIEKGRERKNTYPRRKNFTLAFTVRYCFAYMSFAQVYRVYVSMHLYSPVTSIEKEGPRDYNLHSNYIPSEYWHHHVRQTFEGAAIVFRSPFFYIYISIYIYLSI